nr:MAG TPA: hypothetical protein [Caudoviricetes sp.]
MLKLCGLVIPSRRFHVWHLQVMPLRRLTHLWVVVRLMSLNLVGMTLLLINWKRWSDGTILVVLDSV